MVDPSFFLSSIAAQQRFCVFFSVILWTFALIPLISQKKRIVLVQYFPNKMTGLLFLIQSGVCGKLTWARFQRRSKTTTAQQKRFHPMSNQLSLPWRGGDPTRGQKPLPLWCLSNTMMNWALLVSFNLSLQCCFINPIIRVYLWYETHADLRVLKKI